jgi:hypothetical protein
LSTEQLLAQAAGLDDGANEQLGTEAAIRSDPRLNESQKAALLGVYRAMVEPEANGKANGAGRPTPVGAGAEAAIRPATRARGSAPASPG